jgi:steroid delta-isomerase
MPTHEQMVATVQAYIDGFGQGDAEAVCDLFAADATVEDPVGTPLKIGHEAIRHFYAQSMKTGAKLELEGAVRTAGDTAAFAFTVHLELGEKPMRVDVIDLFTFDEEGKVKSMKAYFGPANMHGFEKA